MSTALIQGVAPDGTIKTIQTDSSGNLIANDGKATASAATVPTDAVVSVANTSTPIVGANANRASVLIKNIDTQTVYLYTGGVATTAKFPLAVGDAITYRNQLAITGIVATGTANVYVIEEQR